MDLYKLLSLPKSASVFELDEAFEAWREDIEHRISSAPTPSLKAKLRKKLRDAEGALEQLTDQSYSELPGAAPNIIERVARTKQDSPEPISTRETNFGNVTASVKAFLTSKGWQDGTSLNFPPDFCLSKKTKLFGEGHALFMRKSCALNHSNVADVLSDWEQVNAECQTSKQKVFSTTKVFVLCYLFQSVSPGMGLSFLNEYRFKTIRFAKGCGYLWIYDASTGNLHGPRPSMLDAGGPRVINDFRKLSIEMQGLGKRVG